MLNLYSTVQMYCYYLMNNRLIDVVVVAVVDGDDGELDSHFDDDHDQNDFFCKTIVMVAVDHCDSIVVVVVVVAHLVVVG